MRGFVISDLFILLTGLGIAVCLLSHIVIERLGEQRNERDRDAQRDRRTHVARITHHERNHQ